MTKLAGAWYGRRTPSTGRAFYVRELRGQLIVCKWPRRRGRPLHPTTQAQNEKFRQANWLTKYVPARIQMAHRIMVEGTQLLPRDMMIAAMYGRGLTFHIPPGRRRYSIAAIQDLSAALDILGAEAGDVIARGPELWQRVRPPSVGYVLTSQAPGELPSYQAISAGAGAWTQIGRVVLGADIALNATMAIAIPANIQELEVEFIKPRNTGAMRVLMRFNDNATASYNTHMIYNGGSGNAIGIRYTSRTAFRWLSEAVGAQIGPLFIRCRINRSNSPNFAMALMGTTGYIPDKQAQLTSYWNNSGGRLTKITFFSDTGVGLTKDTAFTVRAILT